jgi:hypothetical protein
MEIVIHAKGCKINTDDLNITLCKIFGEDSIWKNDTFNEIMIDEIGKIRSPEIIVTFKIKDKNEARLVDLTGDEEEDEEDSSLEESEDYYYQDSLLEIVSSLYLYLLFNMDIDINKTISEKDLPKDIKSFKNKVIKHIRTINSLKSGFRIKHDLIDQAIGILLGIPDLKIQ